MAQRNIQTNYNLSDWELSSKMYANQQITTNSLFSVWTFQLFIFNDYLRVHWMRSVYSTQYNRYSCMLLSGVYVFGLKVHYYFLSLPAIAVRFLYCAVRHCIRAFLCYSNIGWIFILDAQTNTCVVRCNCTRFSFIGTHHTHKHNQMARSFMRNKPRLMILLTSDWCAQYSGTKSKTITEPVRLHDRYYIILPHSTGMRISQRNLWICERARTQRHLPFCHAKFCTITSQPRSHATKKSTPQSVCYITRRIIRTFSHVSFNSVYDCNWYLNLALPWCSFTTNIL